MTDKFLDDLEAALNADNGDEIPEGFERCEDCGGIHPISPFPKYHGPIIYGNDEKAAYPDERTHEMCAEADDALDGALMDKIGTLLSMMSKALQIPPVTMAVNMQAIGALFLSVDAVSKFRAANPDHTQEDLIRVIRTQATDAHVRGQFVNEHLSRMMASSPPPAEEGDEAK